ncbi:MAG: VOC family protein [Clostridiales bacterium]|jgi:catechol 2,3-dioxygenase-like lactoylglutathione lyase family enzyme|nr:VOC family protein [Clostridiales bacterium]
MAGVNIGSIAIDSVNPKKLRDFYAGVTGWEPATFWGSPALAFGGKLVVVFIPCDFDYIPPVWPEEPGQQQKQMHFDFEVDDVPSAVQDAIALGATKPESQYGGEQWVTLLDPEGRPFCLCAK